MQKPIEVAAVNPYRKFHRWLIVFFIASILLRIWGGIEIGIEKTSMVAGGLVFGLVTLILPIIILVGLFRMRGWAYIILFFYGLLNFLYAIPSLLLPFGEIPPSALEIIQSEDIPEYALRATGFFLAFLSFIVYGVVTFLARYCWKKIRPEYTLRDLFRFRNKP